MKLILPILMFLMVTPTWADYYEWDKDGGTSNHESLERNTKDLWKRAGNTQT